MRLSPFSQPHAAACCGRGACDRGLPFARQRTARNLRQQIKPKMNSGLCCRLVLPVRCTSSCDKEGAIRPKEARESPVPRPARQQQAVDVISLLLQESLNSQQQTQALVRTLLERQAHGHEAAAHQPHQLGALISAELLRQRQVRCFNENDICDRVYEDEVMEVIAECDLLSSSGRVQYLPYDPERQGVPVTRFTVAPGMLVRRGYDVREGEERAAEAGEVGVLQPSPNMGDTCLVEWASGSQGTYETGWGDRFELVHLETSRTSGAPVVGSDWTDMEVPQHELLWDGKELEIPRHLTVSRAVGGVAVERGSHWVYGGAEPGVGSIYAAASARQADIGPGVVPVKWPNGQLLQHNASPVDGCDLCYSARAGDPVTLFTAREGLEVETTADGGARVWGALVRPEGIRGDAVLWKVELHGFANTVTYAVESSRAMPGSAPTGSDSPDVAELRFY